VGDVSPGPPIACSDVHGDIVAYMCPFRIGGEPLSVPCRGHGESQTRPPHGGRNRVTGPRPGPVDRCPRRYRWHGRHQPATGIREARETELGIGDYGTVYVSARYDRSPIPLVSHYLSPYYTSGDIARDVARRRIGGEPTLKRYYFLGLRGQFFEFSNGDTTFWCTRSRTTCHVPCPNLDCPRVPSAARNSNGVAATGQQEFGGHPRSDHRLCRGPLREHPLRQMGSWLYTDIGRHGAGLLGPRRRRLGGPRLRQVDRPLAAAEQVCRWHRRHPQPSPTCSKNSASTWRRISPVERCPAASLQVCWIPATPETGTVSARRPTPAPMAFHPSATSGVSVLSTPRSTTTVRPSGRWVTGRWHTRSRVGPHLRQLRHHLQHMGLPGARRLVLQPLQQRRPDRVGPIEHRRS
jgi:hypothetical protein